MAQHDAFLDRMTARLGDLERRLADLGGPHGLEAPLASLRDELRALRREGGELDEDRTRSFAQAYERLNAAVGRSGRASAAARAR